MQQVCIANTNTIFFYQIQLDPSGLYAATSCSDKSVNIYDFEAGECSAVMYGHSGRLVCHFLLRPDSGFRKIVSILVASCGFLIGLYLNGLLR